jgi:predicted metalloprotease with PDZ domain
MDPIPVSLAQASLESWVDGYEADKTPFKSPNFYVKGAIAFWILDLKIQRLSGGHKSLDDFIKYLDANYDTTKGYAYKDIDLALNVSSGLDLSADLEALINVGESILPRLKAEFGAADLLLQESPNPELVQAKLGLKLRNFEVIAVYPDSPANLAEIYTKDKLVAISGVSLENGASLNDLISSHINGQKLKVTIQRSNTLLEITIKLGGVPGELSYYPKFTLTAKD